MITAIHNKGKLHVEIGSSNPNDALSEYLTMTVALVTDIKNRMQDAGVPPAVIASLLNDVKKAVSTMTDNLILELSSPSGKGW